MKKEGITLTENEATALIAVPEALLETAESRHFEGKVALGELAAGPDTYRIDGPVSWSVEMTNTGEALLVMGTADAAAVTACARCLDEVCYDLTGDIEEYVLLGGEEAVPPEEVEGDEFSVLPENRVLDLVPLIEQALRLELPLVPLCDDDCKGLCPRCGANLNEGPCDCAAEAKSPTGPFAVLRDFDFDGE